MEASIALVIPCYNYGRFVSETIESVLCQTLRPTEIVVVDDGSTDNTREVVGRYRDVSYLWKENGGPSSARNRGISHTKAECLLFLDSDDTLRSDALETLWEAWRQVRGDVGAVFAQGCYYRDQAPQDNAAGTVDPEDALMAPHVLRWVSPGTAILARTIWQQLFLGNFISPSCALLARATLDQYGFWDEDIRTIEDWEFWLRIASQCDLAYVSKVVTNKRKHGANITSPENWVSNRLNVLRILTKLAEADWAGEALHQSAVKGYGKTAYNLSQHYADAGDYGEAVRWMQVSYCRSPLRVKALVRLLEYRLRSWLHPGTGRNE